MTNKIQIFPEPLIEFRYGQKMEDPPDGLALFGPLDTDEPSHPKNINYGVIGTEEGIVAFQKWSKLIKGPILLEDDQTKTLWPPFPGFEAVFNSEWSESPSWSHKLERSQLINASRNNDPKKRAYEVVEQYLKGISLVNKKDEDFNILICIVPDEVWKNCRPKSVLQEGWGYKPSKKIIKDRAEGQIGLFNQWKPDQYKHSVDFRRQLKARAMKYGVPIQIIRESTIGLSREEEDINRGMTFLSDRAWNLCTSIYYKSGGKPWKLLTAREGVCYIGISFKRQDMKSNSKTACCAAQMFLDSGDGIVFLGDEGPWYSPRERQCHLSKDSAKRLLSSVLKTYEQLEGKKLKEIFLHYKSDIGQSEFEGYLEACPKGVKLVGIKVRLQRGEIKLFREGSRPVLRGTFWKESDKVGYLWGSGFKPRLQTYDGWEIPLPLRIEIQHGKASIEQVSKDIFGLTKLNYNACRLGDSEPVTIMFSNAVGEILISNPAVKDINPKFKFYI